MSIINDALKKTQQNLNPNVDPKAGGAPQIGDDRFGKPPAGAQKEGAAKTNAAFTATPFGTAPQPTTAPRAKNAPTKNDQPRRDKTLPLLLILLAIGGYYAYKNGYIKEGFLQETVAKLQALLPNQAKPGSPSAKGAVRPGLTLPMKPTVPKNKDGLVLNGVMDNGEKVVALINNEIYEVGDMIKNQQLVEIGSNFVKLSGPAGTSILKIDNSQH